MGTIIFGNPLVADLGSGSPTDRVIGTGDSFPAHPVLIEYNDLIMNDNHNFDYYKITSVDGLDDAEIRDSRSNRPNQDGEDSYGTYYSGRTVVIHGEIHAYDLWKADDMREAVKRAFVRKDKELPLWFHLGDAAKDRIIMCKKNAKLEIPWQQPTRDLPLIPFMVPLRASNPRILSYLLHSYTADPDDTTIEIENAGNYDAEATIRFYGPATTITLEHSYNDYINRSITINNIADGSYIEVVGSRVRDQNGVNAFNKYSDDSDIILLGPAPFVNSFDITGSGFGGNTKVRIDWRDASV